MLTGLFYPVNCLECDTVLEDTNKLFCPPCSELFELAIPEERCPLCFGLEKHSISCGKQFVAVASACSYRSVAIALVRQLKKGRGHALAPSAAALCYLQHERLHFAKPDLIVPVPISPFHHFLRGYNQSFLIATQLGKLLDAPVKNLLGRRFFYKQQTGFSKEQRLALPSDAIIWNSKEKVAAYANVLLVDDVVTTGRTLELCAKVLYRHLKIDNLRALTLCIAD